MSGRADGEWEVAGGELVTVLAALSNPQRIRIVAALARGSVHVSELARAVGLSRPLVHMHLKKLEAAGLVAGRLELSEDGKALRFYEVAPFVVHLTPELVDEAARALDEADASDTQREQEEP